MSLVVNSLEYSKYVTYKGKLYINTGTTIFSDTFVNICSTDRYLNIDEAIFKNGLTTSNFTKVRPIYIGINTKDNIGFSNVKSENNTYDVSIISKDSTNPFYNIGSSNCVSISGYQNLELNLISGKTYYFNQSHPSNTNRVKLTLDPEGTIDANLSNYIYSGNPGVDGLLFFILPVGYPDALYLSLDSEQYTGIKINVDVYYESLPSLVANFNFLSADSYYTILPTYTECPPPNTPTPTPTPTLTPTPTPTPTPTLLGSTPTPTPTPTPTLPLLDNILFDTSTFGSVQSEIIVPLLVGVERWENFIKINPDVVAAIKSFDSEWNGIRLNSYNTINDPNGYIAACQVHSFFDIIPGSTGLQFVTFSFNLYVNLHFLNIYTQTDWEKIMAHELGHALGLGVFWRTFYQPYGAVPPEDFFLDGTAYTSAQGAYNSIASLSRNKIPLENSGGSGTQSSHWENNFRPSTDPGTDGLTYPGLLNELMVGFYSPSINFVISDLSIKTLVDFGYIEKNPGANEGIPTLVNSL